MRPPRYRALVSTFILASIFCFTAEARAAFILSIDDLGDAAPPILVTDEVLPDGFAGLGTVSFGGSIGDFSVVSVTAVSKPVLSPDPKMDLVSLVVTGTNPGTLRIMVTDTDFLSPSLGTIAFESFIGGTTEGSIEAWSYLDPSNTEFGTSLPLDTLGPFSPVAFSDSQSSVISAALLPSPYSMTLVVDVTHESAGDVSSFDFYVRGEESTGEAPVPEPSAFLLSSLGLLMLGLIIRLRRNSNRNA